MTKDGMSYSGVFIGERINKIWFGGEKMAYTVVERNKKGQFVKGGFHHMGFRKRGKKRKFV